MAKKYSTSAFIMDSGERYCLVMDSTLKLPEFYPNLFLTTQIRNKSDSFSTMEAIASHLVVLLRFLDSRCIVLEERLLTRSFLLEYELDALRDFTQHRFGRNVTELSKREPSKIGTPKLLQSIVSNSTQYARLTSIANYFSWLAKHLLSNPNQEDADRIDSIVERIKARRPVKKGRNNCQDKSLSDDQIDALFEIIRLGSNLNPFDMSVQRRNRLMVLLLYHLGIRGGELLNIRISDINFAANRLRIFRRADEKDDPRAREPNVKTLERLIPLSSHLAKELHEYIVNDRRLIRNAKKNDFLFVTHKEGPTVGQPVSKSGYHKLMSVVRAISPQLYSVTGHMLRHTWNRKFSEKMDAMDEPLGEARQEQLRSFLMGWKQGSGTASTYNKRFIEQKGYEAALLMQEKSGTRMPVGIQNEE